MKPADLIRELEYLQDLGIQSLALPEGVQTLSALVSGNVPPRSQGGPAQAVGSAAKDPVSPPRPASKSFPMAASEQVAKPALPTQPPIAAASDSKPAGQPQPAAPPLISLLSRQLKTDSSAEAKFTMYDAIGVDASEDSLARIREDIGDCKRCRLCHGRTNIVFGTGNEEARLVFVGEGPGEDEDLSGLPFVGRAGQLLTRMIEGTAEKEGIPIKRSDVYICNVVKCRPPKNRKPESDEMEICGQFLFRQLAVLKPKAICVLGATAAQALLNTKEKMGDLRGNWQSWRDIPVMVTYHPSYLLRAYSPEAKRLTWEDLKKVLHFVYDDPPMTSHDTR